MKLKTSAVLLAAVIAGFLLGARFSPWRGASPYQAKQANVSTEASTGDIAMHIVSSKDISNPLYKTSVEYPQFPDLSFGEGSFNKSISDLVSGKIKEFAANVKANQKARQDTAPSGTEVMTSPSPYYFAETWQSRQLNSHYASFLVRFNSFEGGANERQEIAAFNYDFAKNKIISLPDLFPGSSDYLRKISKFAQDQLIENLNAQESGGPMVTDMILSGAAPTPDNFANFVFDDDVIEFFFPKYQVAPGVYGEQHVIFPRVAAL